MYEFQLTGKINNVIQNLCWRYNFRKVNRILLKAGAMRKINPELMTFIFASISQGTPAEGAMLSVMIIPITFKCCSCGRTWTTDDTEFLCPYCRSRDVDLLTGLEFAVDFLEVES